MGESVLGGLTSGLVAFRWAALVWICAVVALSWDRLSHPLGAVALLGAALVVTAAATWAMRERPTLLLDGRFIGAEVAVGMALLAGDGAVYAEPHPQSLGSAWVLPGVFAAALAGGTLWGLAAGALLGVGRLVGELWLVGADDWTTGRTIAVTSAVVLFLMAGGVSGDVFARLRRADQEVTTARARAEVARTLHDGVLQTLGVIQRRSGDAALVRLAREQDRELRTFLAGLGDRREGLRPALRKVLDRVEARYELRAELVMVDEPDVAMAVVDALAAAVGEAANNAGRHGGARRVTVFVDADDAELLCTVKDDGTGFDPSSTPEGTGIRGSLRAPIESIGGAVSVRSRPGTGSEVVVTVPLRGALTCG